MRQVVFAVLAACYAPVVPEGTICDSPEHCPTGLVCVDGACRRPGATTDDASSDGITPTDGTPIDGTTIDAMIDAPLGCSPTGFQCQGGYVLNSCNGMCFIRCANSLSRDDAKARCAAWFGTLAVFDSVAANSCANLVDTPSSWIGLEQTAGQTTPITGWTWNGTTAVSFMAWGTGDPDDGDGTENSGKNCGTAEAGTWRDVACAEPRGFICRR